MGIVASVPAETLLGGGILLQARVNGSGPHTFALDSAGGSGFIVDARLAKTLGLALQGEALSSGAGGNQVPVSFAKNVVLDLSGVLVRPRTVAVIDLASLEPLSGRTIAGIVGYGLFARYVVKIDYAAHQVDLYSFDAYQYSGEGTSVPLRTERDHFYVAARVRMPGRAPIDGKFMIDTGAPMTTIAFSTPFVERFRLLPNVKGRIVDRSFAGLGGETTQVLGRANELDFGDLRIRNATVTFAQDTAGTLASADFDGIIGGELLRRFNVIFDPPRRRLILEPNGHFNEPYEHNMSGIALRAEVRRGGTLTIHRIIAGSPAEEAGLRAGDELEAIDGRPAAGFTLDALYEMFKKEGREYVFRVRRGPVTLRARIRLRRLV
ncbi:MAG TPA: aspartyl protease family protein [Thermoanaerobaculia bacterium]